MIRKTSRKRAFTLAEIMIVIVLIAVLAGFLLPAVMNSQRAARNTRARVEINAIAMAIEAFYDDWGFYPPTDRAYNPATGRFDGEPYGDYSYAEALVQCLANRFVRGAGDQLPAGETSFRNMRGGVYQVYELGGAPVNAGPYYDLSRRDVADLDNDGFPALLDPWGNPYIYIPREDYLRSGLYNAGALVMIDYTGDGVIDIPNLNDPLPAGYNHYNRFTFQLISRGEDGWTPGVLNFRDISITGNPYGQPPSATNLNPALIGTDTDPSNPYVVPAWGHTAESADDINNWTH